MSRCRAAPWRARPDPAHRARSPDFAYASLASNRRLELEGGVEIDAELCAVCTTALIEFIDVGPGPGVRIVPVEISF